MRERAAGNMTDKTTAEIDLKRVEGILGRTAVVIPARNEEASVGRVLADLPPVSLVILANNGSTDATAQIARDAGAVVIDEDIPGYGRACRVGLFALRREIRRRKRAAAEGHDLPADIEYVVFLDADYSDHPDELLKLVTPIAQGEADFVIGSRLLGQRERGAMPPQSLFGNRLACFLIRVIWGAKYTDLGPFRAIRYDKLQALHMKDLDFGWTVEMQVKAAQHGLRTIEIPVAYRKRIGTSKISGTIVGTFKAGYKILYTIGKYALLSRSAGRLDAGQ